MEKCPYCSTVLKNKQSLKRHIARLHPEEKPEQPEQSLEEGDYS